MQFSELQVTCNASKRPLLEKLRGHVTYRLELPAGSDLALVTALMMRVHYECICNHHNHHSAGGGRPEPMSQAVLQGFSGTD